mmetsp:Transcript_6101/g.9207  ORF Transcript_6101/g.9207 Transcript_6101/m.9207 type:complete len:347 (+) Transcript_6101:220-1260(+)|eukprot:CAMPEP_0185036038 /NCGR_PEP_ID=MMETSP1103-20130426/28419_1 /TAXON_ID=36769 /ORGANISM="Paraphysomonas bandaiensis, Strain Caron Lab Isolate" /LENGTH=346 /DNA_ID=CAMNT_0027573407 /DNA_START=114 /DNA_END=1154 /DNA_ORIENTATION=-
MPILPPVTRPHTRHSKVKSVLCSHREVADRLFPASRRFSAIFSKKTSANHPQTVPQVRLKSKNNEDGTALQTAEALLQKQEWETWCKYNGIYVGSNFEITELDLVAFRRMFMSLKDKHTDSTVHFKTVAKSLLQYGIFRGEEEALVFARNICPRGSTSMSWSDILKARHSREMHVRNRITYYIKEVADRGLVEYKNTALHVIAVSSKTKNRHTPQTSSTTAVGMTYSEDERNTDEDSFRQPRTGNIRISSINRAEQKFSVIPIQMKPQTIYRKQSSDVSSRRGYGRSASSSIRRVWGRQPSTDSSARESDESSRNIRLFMRQESGHTYRMHCGGRTKQAAVHVYEE